MTEGGDCTPIEYEWGVLRAGGLTGGMWHRDMSEEAARRYVAEWLADGGKPGVFRVMRRPIGAWEEVTEP